MSAEEFVEWIAFNRIEPFGEERMDWRFAQLICSMLRALGGKPKMADYFWTAEPQRQSPQEVEHVLRSFFEAHQAWRPPHPS